MLNFLLAEIKRFVTLAADATLQGFTMSATPEEKPGQIQPIPATAHILPNPQAPQYPIDPILANNLAWMAWLMKWGWKIGVTVGTVLLLAIGWLLTVFVDMRSKINSVDDKIKAEVAIRSDDLRKELNSEAKEHAEELNLLKDTIEVEQTMVEMVCQSAPDEALLIYKIHIDKIKPKDIPNSMKPGVYRSLLNAVINSRNFQYLRDEDLSGIESVIRKDTSSCGALNLGKIAQIYAAHGNFEKARGLSLASIEMFLNARSGQVQPDQLAYSYSTLIDTELAQHKSLDRKGRSLKAWETLALLEQKFVVSTTLILSHFADPSSRLARKERALSAGGIEYLEACAEVELMLDSKDFETEYVDVEERASNGKIVLVKKAVIVEKTKKDKKDKKIQSIPAPMKCCGG